MLVAPSSSSTKKAAKLAKSGQGKKVRFQGGTMFPLIVALVVVLGLGAGHLRPAESTVRRRLGPDHGRPLAHGLRLLPLRPAGCSSRATRKTRRRLATTSSSRTGIHSHDDGVVHWHPFTSASVGKRAKLSIFLDVYGVELTNDKLTFPDDQRAQLPYQNDTGVFEEGETQCDIDGVKKDGELKVIVWNNFSDTDDGTTYVADFDNIRVTDDAMVFSIAFVPAGTDVGMPPWAANLPELGGADSYAGDSAVAERYDDPRRPDGAVVHGRASRQHRPRRCGAEHHGCDHDCIGGDDGRTVDHRRIGRLMRAVVLVGGFGTRLRPLTYTTPKPMLPIGHRPMIARLIDRLGRGGVTEVVLALGFKPEPFVEAFPDGFCGDVAISYAVEPEPLDTAGAIRFAADAAGIDDTFIVANGDVLTDLDVSALVGAHRRLGAEATIHLIAVDDPSSFGVVDIGEMTDGAGLVNAFVEKPAPGTEPSNLISAGTYVLEPSVLELMKPGVRASIERDVFPIGRPTRWPVRRRHRRLLDRCRVAPSCTARQTSTCSATCVCTTGASRSTAPPSSASSAIVRNSIVGAGAEIGSNASVIDSVILPGARVGQGALVESSLVMGVVGSNATVSNGMVGAARPRGRRGRAARRGGSGLSARMTGST